MRQVKKLVAPVAGEERTVIEHDGKDGKPLIGYHKRIFRQAFMTNGKSGDWLLIDNDLGSAVIILPFTKKNEVVAIRQFRQGAKDFIIELPGGMPKPGQKPEDVLVDELKEETGYTPENIIRMSSGLWFEPVMMRAQFVPYLATGCEKVQAISLDEFEVLEPILYPWDEWLSMIKRGAITDSKTIAITLLALLRLDTL